MSEKINIFVPTQLYLNLQTMVEAEVIKQPFTNAQLQLLKMFSRQNLNKKDLAKTSWFKNEILKVLKEHTKSKKK